ncbi:MAG: ACP phosphodiesterase [Thermodesulfobacteriota bacterium]
MNYLLHLLFSAPESDCYVGNMMGDFVKGRLETQQDKFSPGVLRGLQQHRLIDSHAQRSAIFRRSYQRLDQKYGLYRGILVDLFYDHFAALHWERFHPQALTEFAPGIYATIKAHPDLVPAFAAIVPRMVEYNWLVAYSRPAAIERALNSISQRASARHPLNGALAQLELNYAALEQDCLRFIPETLAWIRKERYKPSSPWRPEI